MATVVVHVSSKIKTTTHNQYNKGEYKTSGQAIFIYAI
jgi:hypothetical protein